MSSLLEFIDKLNEKSKFYLWKYLILFVEIDLVNILEDLLQIFTP